ADPGRQPASGPCCRRRPALGGDRMPFNQLKRREFITLVGGAAAAWPLGARAQQPGKLQTIGFLGAPTPSAWRAYVPAVGQRLNELGWIEGRTATIVYRWGGGRPGRYPESAAEFVPLEIE